MLTILLILSVIAFIAAVLAVSIWAAILGIKLLFWVAPVLFVFAIFIIVLIVTGVIKFE